jgi:L,D-peptidoglycan transpeptidase YkuD (ErfK/YbiS/YcfS/YnhG family)
MLHHHPNQIFVDHLPAGAGFRARAVLRFGMVRVPCRIGRNGVSALKKEGDGKTPRGTLRPVRGFWRADRALPMPTGVPLRPIRRDDGWCDAPGHGQYNRLVRLPFPASHEELWRADDVYDYVLELDWNRRPRVQGRGSAIFLHLMREDGSGTAGCIAVAPRHIRMVLAMLSLRTRIIVR